MSILRLVVAWLVMAALPMQGIAAASMLFCDQAAHSTAQQQASHEHASHDHGHDHAAHGHDGHDGQEASHGAKASSGGDDHACPICASCCNLLALSEAPTLSLDSARPAPPPLQGPSRVATREAPGPDKPPRA